jgi:GMP synthase (glutamine-hydrolysing)
MGYKEIGFSPLTITTAGVDTPLSKIGSQAVLHWHGDQFDMPNDIVSLCSTELCPHQAFMVEQHAMAWQFHLEVNPAKIEQWLIGHAGEIAQAGLSVDTIRSQAKLNAKSLSQALDAVMGEWFGLCKLA